jgi:hypothetical protein
MGQAENAIYRSQVEWAEKSGLALDLRDRGRKPYAQRLSDNLIAELPPDVREQFEAGAGDELRSKMLALHSSSALAVNVFLRWQPLSSLDGITRALGLPGDATGLEFEATFEKPPGIPGKKPHLDVALSYPSGAPIDVAAVESKFIEPYRDGPKPLKAAYLEENVWSSLPNCGDLAARMGEGAATMPFESLDAAQLLKHALCLHHVHGRRFVLIYLWFEQPGPEAETHRAEIERFADALLGDGLRFRAMTYQELIEALSSVGEVDPAYLGYLKDRYVRGLDRPD